MSSFPYLYREVRSINFPFSIEKLIEKFISIWSMVNWGESTSWLPVPICKNPPSPLDLSLKHFGNKSKTPLVPKNHEKFRVTNAERKSLVGKKIVHRARPNKKKGPKARGEANRTRFNRAERAEDINFVGGTFFFFQTRSFARLGKAHADPVPNEFFRRCSTHSDLLWAFTLFRCQVWCFVFYVISFSN